MIFAKLSFWAALSVTALPLGCSPDLIEGKYACAANVGCPNGWVCREDDRCWRTAAGVGLDAGSNVDSDVGFDARCQEAVTKLDILLMVDDSGSMETAQTQLEVTIPRLTTGIAEGDFDADGNRDFRPVTDINLGVITPNLGVGAEGSEIPLSHCDMVGDDGRLGTRSASTTVNCSGSFGPVVQLRATDPASISTFSNAATCLATTGSDGCNFEQQLESVLKAVTPPSSSLRFFGDTLGHAGPEGPNAGFLRDDATLLIILVTDELDCSIEDYAPFFDEPEGDLNALCRLRREFLWDVSRYIDGLSALKPDHPERLIFTTLSGIPEDLGGQSPEAILADPRMAIEGDGTPPFACDGTTAKAQPARRSLTVSRGLSSRGHTSIHHSICADSYDQFNRAILLELQALQIGTCE